MLKSNNLMGLGVAAQSELKNIVLFTSATVSNSTTIVAPATIKKGDLLVLADRKTDATTPAYANPSGFFYISDFSDGTSHVVFSCKIADGTEAGATLTGMTHGATSSSMILGVYRGNVPIKDFAIGAALSEITTGNPTPQVINLSAPNMPADARNILAFGFYDSSTTTDPRSMTPAKDGEIANSSNNTYLAHKYFAENPTSVTVDMDDEGTNRLASFHLRLFGDEKSLPKYRYVGNYTLTFSASATGTLNIPTADLQYPADAKRQIWVVLPDLTVGDLLQFTMDGVTRNAFYKRDWDDAITVIGAANSRASGDIPVSITAVSSGTTTTQVLVFEVYNAAPLHECLHFIQAHPSGLVLSNEGVVPDRSALLLVGDIFPDTSNFSGSFPRIFNHVNIDAGSRRLGAGTVSKAFSGKQRFTWSATSSATNAPQAILIAVLPADTTMVRGGIYMSTRQLAAADPQTISTPTSRWDFTGLGTGKAIMVFLLESGQSPDSVTVGGQPATQVGVITSQPGSTDASVAIWEYDFDDSNPGPHDIVVDWSSLPGQPNFFERYLLYGVNSRNFSGNRSIPGTAASGTVALSDGGCLIAAHIRATNGQTVTWTNAVEFLDTDVNSTYRASEANRWDCEAEAARVVTATGSASGNCVTGVAAFNP